ncbi:inovirus-type Gp2 protein [Duganella sp. FT134W]|uniref:Inovirus-type Gp2 protein n=1 Tax=Duganella margarita TaxID=2692170 RepID=A0A7X4H640_9BURK|nr:inovirus-type Gp2 protein [Duganella margarita]MYM76065.1 inovirus-type Gp2 protein [Duganella margarita]
MMEKEKVDRTIDSKNQILKKYLKINDRDMYRNIDKERNLSFDYENFNERTDLRSAEGIIYSGFGNCLINIEELVKQIEKSDLLAYQYRSNGLINNRSSYVLTKIGENLVPYFSAMIECFEDGFEYSEHVNAFFNSLNAIYSRTQNSQCLPRTPQFFNELVTRIRDEAASKTFKRKVAVRNHNVIRNFESVYDLVDSLFLKYSRLLVLRIDLCYRKEARNSISAEKASEHRKDFLNRSRGNSIFNHRVGYIWKLEYGEYDKHHFHFAFFFDGAKVRNDWFIGNEIGKYWIEFTQGDGAYHVCYKTQYKRPGVGMIRHDDRQMRDNLMFSLAYLVKKEQFLRKKISKRAKAFSTSFKPKSRVGARGRKRKSLNEALVIN